MKQKHFTHNNFFVIILVGVCIVALCGCTFSPKTLYDIGRTSYDTTETVGDVSYMVSSSWRKSYHEIEDELLSSVDEIEYFMDNNAMLQIMFVEEPISEGYESIVVDSFAESFLEAVGGTEFDEILPSDRLGNGGYRFEYTGEDGGERIIGNLFWTDAGVCCLSRADFDPFVKYDSVRAWWDSFLDHVKVND